jgi:hypothetical protein
MLSRLSTTKETPEDHYNFQLGNLVFWSISEGNGFGGKQYREGVSSQNSTDL